MFGQRAGRALGALAFDSLAISRGETITKRPLSQPHHRECPACGFDRWDGYSDHRWGGGRFAQRTCYGPEQTAAQQQAKPNAPMNPLIDELRGFATGVGEELEPEPVEAPVEDVNHRFEILGDARDR